MENRPNVQETALRRFRRQFITSVGLTEILPKQSEHRLVSLCGFYGDRNQESTNVDLECSMMGGVGDILGCIARPSVIPSKGNTEEEMS